MLFNFQKSINVNFHFNVTKEHNHMTIVTYTE